MGRESTARKVEQPNIEVLEGHACHDEHCGCAHSHESKAAENEACGCKACTAASDLGHVEDDEEDDGHQLAKVIAAAVIYFAAILAHNFWPGGLFSEGIPALVVFLIPYAIVGYAPIIEAVKGIAHGDMLDENFLMTIATVAAFVMGEYPEAVAVMLFFQVGELFEDYAVGKSQRSITAMMDIQEQNAFVERNGIVIEVASDSVAVGETLVVKPGERVALDGVLIEGEGDVDTSALTGESVPAHISAGDEVMSGYVNGATQLRIRTTHAFEDSTVARILDMVRNASSKKAHIENFITRFARIYTPIVVGLALALAVLPPIAIGLMAGTLLDGALWADWIKRACVFLVISCPCALVISVPLSFFGGIGALSRLGVLVKGGNYLEALARLDTVVFDKTGTLTEGVFKVTGVHPADGVEEEELLRAAAIAESSSNHPIARSILAAFGAVPPEQPEEVVELAGHGLDVNAECGRILVGNGRLMEREALHAMDDSGIEGTIVHVALAGRYLGFIAISDTVKQSTPAALSALRRLGVAHTVMLTGDKHSVASRVASDIGIDSFEAELLPGDKVGKVEELLERTPEKKTLGFVGDGINDAPVLMRADVGIAMGAMGSDAAVEAADVVLMDDDPARIADGIRISRKTVKIAKQNIVFALSVKLVLLALGAFGLANMWMAVFGDVGVSVIAIINAMRMLRAK